MKLTQTIDWYNRHAEHYQRQTAKYTPKAQMNDFVRQLPKPAQILDAGCGPGLHSHLLAQRGYEVTGIDLSEELLKIARHEYPEINFVQGNFCRLPFPDQSFNAVWAHASLVHLETAQDAEQAIREFARVTKPAGILHIMAKAQVGSEKFVTLIDSRTNDQRFFQLYTLKEITDMATQAGYNTIKTYQFTDKNSNKKYHTPVDWLVYLGQKK